jgi:hypothetical protein
MCAVSAHFLPALLVLEERGLPAEEHLAIGFRSSKARGHEWRVDERG